MNRVIYKTSEGEIRELGHSDCIDIPNRKVSTFFDLSKDRLYLSLNRALEKDMIPLLYDKNIRSIASTVENIDFDTLPGNTAAIFFTSGTTGEPTGVIKSKENIMEELEVLKGIFHSYGFEQVIVTVPLIHIYGFLTGVLLPHALGADVILKEEFMPHELLELAGDKRTLCVTNPVFLKALNRLNRDKQYTHITFLSSTGKLDADIIQSLNKKIHCKIYQLFGSTETGGIAYKVNDEEFWRPLPGVKIGKKKSILSVDSPFVSKFVMENDLKEIKKPFVTTDIVELEGNRFRLLGRESEIIKIAGKRISILETEALIEKSELIDEALVKLVYNVSSHKDEQMDISIVSSVGLDEIKKEVKSVLQNNYKNINIRTAVRIVESIAKNHMGKKIRR